jgi:hypothetical protein
LSHVQAKEQKEKARCLDDFNKLFKTFKNNPKKEERKDIGKAFNKLVHSTSATNLKIRVTRD